MIGQDNENAKNIILGFVLLLGIGMFLFAMWWDGSDRARLTRRSDVAFWLHLLAAPMIVHPIFTLLGLTGGHASIGEGLAVVVLYIVLGITALAIDRRALLVSALAYVLYALQALFREFGAVELNIALTALVIGSALLLLSAFWHQARAAIVRPLPGEPARAAAVARSGGRGPGYPTSRISRRSSGASTPARSWPRLSTCAMLAHQCERPLLQPKRGAFFDAHLGPLGMAPEGRENRDVGIDPQRIIAPVPGRDHPPIEVEDPRSARVRSKVAIGRRSQGRGNGAMTLKRFWPSAAAGAVPSALAISLRSSSISCSSSPIRARTGSTSSPHGVP